MAQTPGAQPPIIFQTPNPIVDRREENLNHLLAQAARFVNLKNTELRLQNLRKLFEVHEPATVVKVLRTEGFEIDPSFETQDLRAMLDTVAELIREIERRAQVPEITTSFKQKLTAALDRPADTSRHREISPEDESLEKLKEDFAKGLFVLEEKNVKPLPGERPIDTLKRKQPDKSSLTWEDVVERLNRPHWKNHDKTGLELALAMKDGGELMGVDKAGRLLIRDRGPEPALLGGDYWETYEKVYGSEEQPTGYELFSKGDDQFQKPPVIGLYERIRSHFIEGTDMNETSTWLDNGRDIERTFTSVRTLDARKVVAPVGVVYRDLPIPRSDVPVGFVTPTISVPYRSGQSATFTGTSITPNNPHVKLPTRGAVRLLKV